MPEQVFNTSNVLEQIEKFYNVSEIAQECSVNPSTVHRWLNGQVELKTIYLERLYDMIQRKIVSFKAKNREYHFTFIDLFAGIGGIRKGFELAGGKCVFTSEWDAYARKTYTTNFPSNEPVYGDITQISEKEIPGHDVLLAGFPCQPFSIAGVSKKNALGCPTGFADLTQGTLFFDVARIIKEKKPKAFVLENVKNLKSHNKGNTFKVITSTLTRELGYTIDYKVIDGQSWVPQHRERIVIVGFREPTLFSLENINYPPKGEIKLSHILHKKDGHEPFLDHDKDKYFNHKEKKVLDKYTLTDHLWEYLQSYAEKHKAAGNGFGFGLVKKDDIARTLSARYYKDGSEILVYQGKKKNPRRLTPRECARLMGYPDDFIIPVSDTRAYKQFGNSVVVPLFHTIAEAIKPLI
ncbi:MAG: DNA (cytosine-5-)-methyltransferase [Treponema sp.]|nr:DNA (cytosine-5-)-methyltransferase [Treponema sp.]